jgi:hypothetical protein
MFITTYLNMWRINNSKYEYTSSFSAFVFCLLLLLLLLSLSLRILLHVSVFCIPCVGAFHGILPQDTKLLPRNRLRKSPDKHDFHGNQQSQKFMYCCERCLHLGPPQDINWDIPITSTSWNPLNAEWTRYQDMLIGWPSVVTWLWHWLHFGLDHLRSEVTLRLTVSQYVLALSPPWDLRPDINSAGPSYYWRLYIQGPVPPGGEV